MLKKLFAAGLIVSLLTSVAMAGSPTGEYLHTARQALQRGEQDEALAAATKAVDGDPKNPSCYATRAMIYDSRREFDKAVADYSKSIEFAPGAVGAYQRRGEDHFRLGRFEKSVADFDKVIELEPEREPYHWQRGISLYYAGEFERGAKQFDGHKAVNPNDVENAVWHYLCIARLSGAEKATAGLMKIEGDGRVPMVRVHEMFSGSATPADVLKEAEAGQIPADERKHRLFYAHLYIGLFQEAAGPSDTAREHILIAVEKYAVDDYMGDVARVQAAVMKRKKSADTHPLKK